MRYKGNLWESMGIYGNLWESMGIYGNLYESIGIYGILWESAAGRENPQSKSLENLWESMGIPRKSIGIYRNWPV